jgi:hypothetical protein
MIWRLLIFLFWVSTAHAQLGQQPGWSPVTAPAAVRPPYTGLGDINPGYQVFFSTRAMSSALRGNKVVNACVSGQCADLFSSATTGDLVPAVIGTTGITCPGNAGCTANWYDQVSGHLTTAAVANQPTFAVNAFGGPRTCLNFNSQALPTTTEPFPPSSTMTLTYLAQRTGNTSNYGAVLYDTGTNPFGYEVGFSNQPGNLYVYAGAGNPILNVSAVEGLPHSVQTVFSGSSSITIDGAATALTPGPIASSGVLQISNGMTGIICEAGGINADTTNTNAAVTSSQLNWFTPVVLTTPIAGTTVGGTISVNAICNPSCSQVVFQVDGATYQIVSSGTPFNTTYDTTALMNGSHTFTAQGTTPGGVYSVSAQVNVNNSSGTPGTYYISLSGNDSNNGLTPATAWKTPKHNLNCSATGGDTITVQPGHYPSTSFYLTNWGQPGAGCQAGTYRTLKCAGPTLSACFIDDALAGGFAVLYIDTPYWIIEGFQTSANTGQGCMGGAYFPPSNQRGHHIVFINNWTHDCSRSSAPADYNAFIGLVSWHMAYGANDSGLDPYELVPCQPVDCSSTYSGTHVFVAGAFVFHAQNPPNSTDGEGVIFDDWDCTQQSWCATFGPFTATGAVVQSMFIGNGSNGVYSFNASQSQHNVFSTTVYNNNQDTQSCSNALADVFWNGGAMNLDHVIVQSNVQTNTHWCQANFTGSVSGGTLTVSNINCGNPGGWCGPIWVGMTLNGSGISPAPTITAILAGTTTAQAIYANGNLTYAGAGTTGSFTLSCSPNCPTVPTTTAMFANGFSTPFVNNIYALLSSFGSGTVTNTNYFGLNGQHFGTGAFTTNHVTFGSGNSNLTANFSNTSVLPTSSTGPDCSTFATTTACMQSVINGMKYTNASIPAGLGYQPPGPCGTDPGNAAWPAWIPVSIIPTGLVTVPCTAGPTVTLGSGSSPSYVGTGAHATLSSTVTVADPNSSTLSSATIQITSGSLSSDVLSFTNQNNITGVYNASASGGPLLTLTASPPQTLTTWNTALQSVQYFSSVSTPTNGGANPSRTITWIVTE